MSSPYDSAHLSVLFALLQRSAGIRSARPNTISLVIVSVRFTLTPKRYGAWPGPELEVVCPLAASSRTLGQL